ncbi:hypothetical protein MBLNU230_g6584t1 [Neophaeotheca triangularis]
MPPHLHPRSRATGTLFTSTLAISFLVVAAPHFLPSCPVDRRQFADTIVDGNGTPIKRRRRKQPQPLPEESPICEQNGAGFGTGSEIPSEEVVLSESDLKKRECPVPKPGGLVGQVLGFRRQEHEGRQPTEVVVKDLDRRRGRDGRDETP